MPNSVSVVVPAYNAQATINECLDSLCQQTGVEALEIVVVDDASTDSTVERVLSAQREMRGGVELRLVRQQRNQGPAAARNAGALAARGDIVLFTDSDCVASPHWVREMIAPFTDPEVAAVKGAYRTRQRELAARFAQAEFDERYHKLAAARTVDVVFSYSAAFRKETFWKVGGFDVRFPTADNEDTDLSYRLAAAGYRIVFNPRATIYHRHPNTLQKYLTKKFSRAYWRACVYQRFPGKAVQDSYTPHSLKLQIGFIYLAAPATLLALFTPLGWFALVILFAAFFATTAPFFLRAPRGDVRLLLAAPFFLFCRAAVMALGLLYATPRLLKKEMLYEVNTEREKWATTVN